MSKLRRYSNYLLIGALIILSYYFLCGLGAFLVIASLYYFVLMYSLREFKWTILKFFGLFLIGIFLLWITIPSLKSVLTRDFEVLKGKCTVEITSSTFGRHTNDTTINVLDTDEQFEFQGIPDLDAYGTSIPYYCKVTVTKDHMWGMKYKIFDLKTRKLLESRLGE